jgi:REP element-mobilizing transposase RayT
MCQPPDRQDKEASISRTGFPRWHSRGYLPHFEGGSIPQFVTFRLADSLPKQKLMEWDEELRHWPAERAAAERRRRIEDYLDRGAGEALLRSPRLARLVEGALLYFDAQRYRVHAWVVMPNHVHVLFTPLESWTLSSIVGSWKSFTAKQAGRLLNGRGSFWQEDYYDRFIRNRQHFTRAKEYIESNPVKAGLCAASEDWEFGSAARVSE